LGFIFTKETLSLPEISVFFLDSIIKPYKRKKEEKEEVDSK